jgi:hypothetical protein
LQLIFLSATYGTYYFTSNTVLCATVIIVVLLHTTGGGDGRAQPGPHSGALTKHAMLIRAGKRHRLYTQQRLTHLEQLKHEIIKRK